jgi:putative endonuclease
MLMPFHFYLARCTDDSLYSGYCKDLVDREKTHNEGKGAKYTRARRPVEIIYSEKFATRSEAMQREAAVKKLTKIEKEKLVDRGRV